MVRRSIVRIFVTMGKPKGVSQTKKERRNVGRVVVKRARAVRKVKRAKLVKKVTKVSPKVAKKTQRKYRRNWTLKSLRTFFYLIQS